MAGMVGIEGSCCVSENDGIVEVMLAENGSGRPAVSGVGVGCVSFRIAVAGQ